MKYLFRVVDMKTKEETYSTTDPQRVVERFASMVRAKFFLKMPSVKRMTRMNNYDGTETYKVYLSSGYRYDITLPENL